MYSTPAYLAKLAMVQPKVCKTTVGANKKGTPWEFQVQWSYCVVRKDSDLDRYVATFSLVPPMCLGFILLLAGLWPPVCDLVVQAYIAVLLTTWRGPWERQSAARYHRPERGPLDFTFSNTTIYEVCSGPVGELHLHQFGPRVAMPGRHVPLGAARAGGQQKLSFGQTGCPPHPRSMCWTLTRQVLQLSYKPDFKTQ